MSYQRAQRSQLSNKEPLFSGWYVDNATNVDMQPYFSPYLRNCRLDWSSIEIRPWHILFAELTDWSYPKWVEWYLRTAGSFLVVRHNQDTNKKLVKIEEDGTITDIETSTNISSDNKMRFINSWDVLYCMNGSDNYGKLSNVTYSTPSVWISNFAPAFGVVFNSSMFVAGWSTNPSIVYKSVWDNFEDFNSAWSDKFTFVEEITGLAATTQWLFYFTKNTISATGMSDIQDTAGTLSYITRVMNAKEWAVNHDSIVSAGIEVFYLTPNNNINKLMRWVNNNWFEQKEISQRSNSGISKFMQKTLDKDQSQSFGYFLPKENIIKRHVKSQWAVFNDYVIVYNILDDAFFIDTNKYFFDWCVFNSRYYTLSMIEPKVYIDEEWATDENAPIPREYRTKEFFEWEPTFNKVLRESRTLMDINELAECTQEIWIDWALADTKTVDKNNMKSLLSWGIGTYPVGEEPIGEEWSWWWEGVEEEIILMRTKGNLNKKFRKLQRRRKNTTVAGKVRLKSLTPKIAWLPAEDTHLTK